MTEDIVANAGILWRETSDKITPNFGKSIHERSLKRFVNAFTSIL